MATNKAPYVEIVEQPARNGTRFRYECEGKYKGNLRGASGGKRSFPKLRVVNHKGPVSVIASCVSAEEPYRPHPHRLSQASKLQDHGACFYYFQPHTLHNMTFPNLSVQCCAKKSVDKSLQDREKMQIDPFKTGFEHRKKPRLIDLNCVRVCFQVFLESADPAQTPTQLPPIVSEPIYDRKSVGELNISWISHNAATADGGTVVCLLCEKVCKNDVEVIFSSDDGSWEAVATLVTPEVYRQVSIVFRTPAYVKPESVKKPMKATLKIRRISTDEYSEPRDFLILPSDKYEHVVVGKRKRLESRSEMCELLQAEMLSNPNRLTAGEPMVCNTGKIEPWELPPVSEFPYLQPPQVQYESATANGNIHYNIAAEAGSKQPHNGASDTLNSDSWVKDLLEILDDPKVDRARDGSAIAPEPEIQYIVPESQPAPAISLTNVHMMDMSTQQMDCLLNNGNTVQESSQVASENMRDSVKEFLDTLYGLDNED